MQKTKLIIGFVLLVALLIAGAVGYRIGSRPGTKVGRFRIDTIPRMTTLLLDTATGHTWELNYVPPTDSQRGWAYWKETPQAKEGS